VVRELGLDRREAGWSLSASCEVKSGLKGRTKGSQSGEQWWGVTAIRTHRSYLG